MSHDTTDSRSVSSKYQLSKSSNLQFQTLINSLTDIVVFKDGSGRWIEANTYAIKVFHLNMVPGGYQRKTNDELSRYSPLLLTLLEGCKASDRLAWETGEPVTTHEFVTDETGRTFVYAVTKITTFYADGRRRQLILVGRNITESIHAREQLSHQEQMYRSLFEHHPDPVFTLDTNGIFTHHNPATGSYAEELIGKSFQDVVPAESLGVAVENFQAVLRGETRNYQIEFVDRYARKRRLHMTNIPITIQNQVQGVFGIAKDITDYTEAQQRIHDLAYLDLVTRLPNRTAFEEKLTVCMSEARETLSPISLMLLDLDNFKRVNDTFGYLTGDEVLASVAKRIQSSVPSTAYLFSFNSDKFALVIPRRSKQPGGREEAVNIADQIIAALQAPLVVDNHTFYVTASIGISSFPESGERGRDLLKAASIAMSRAKEHGKNQWWVFDPTMNLEMYRQFVLRNELRQAIYNNHLVVHYQPKVDPTSHEIVGLEALLRWEHPIWGLVSPGDFIPLAEESGLIGLIGNWVLRAVCQDLKIWADTGLPVVPVSVNVSGTQINRFDFVRQLRTMLEEFGVDAFLLEIELTESAIIRHQNVLSQTIHELHEMGVRIVVDDFGTGYSSLSQLRKFQFDALKIDKSFVEGIHADSDAIKLVNAIVQMAHSIGLSVTVEGVETSEQATLLRECECEQFQGFLFSRPVPTGELVHLLKAKSIHPPTNELNEICTN